MEMKQILFNGDMVRAILDGCKTVTRRVVKPNYRDNEIGFNVITNAHTGEYVCIEYLDEWEDVTRHMPEPYRPGDILYVRETWAKQQGVYWHKAGLLLDKNGRDSHGTVAPTKWHPSIHMPREAARIFLRVTDVRVERLQRITPEQIDTEGCKEWAYSAKTGELLPSGPSWFIIAWDNTIKPADRALYGWDANPWVWVIEFERISREEACRC